MAQFGMLKSSTSGIILDQTPFGKIKQPLQQVQQIQQFNVQNFSGVNEKLVKNDILSHQNLMDQVKVDSQLSTTMNQSKFLLSNPISICLFFADSRQIPLEFNLFCFLWSK